MSRADLKKQLIDMTPEEVADLIKEAKQERAAEEERQRAAVSNDPLGTIRYDEDVMWVRTAGTDWEPWLRDTHGNSRGDHEVNWRECPIVGTMPPEWVALEQHDQDRYYR